MKQDRNKGRVHLTCFLSILAIVITLCVQLGFHHAHQIALSHANFKADAKPLKIGQDVTIDTDNYRVNSADLTENIGNRVAQPGNKLLTISLTIKNLTKKDFGTGKGILPYTRDVFHLQANDQNVPFLTDQELPNSLAEEGEVPVDSSLTANLYAEVPENSKVQLVYGTKPTDAKLRERVPSFIVQLN
ncbi:DUF4352 domain-containing protein [Convivina intestini]|uniref:DUF4352 domain-containing protein n=1 Tax=Convivina intestini TaxID=1505726 RepID=UPI00200C068C|nr:DUF4352 domain-containing protein [Convivina intestini]CAH1855545.1 hypothetical protein R078131_01208 [Convivina intestini]